MKASVSTTVLRNAFVQSSPWFCLPKRCHFFFLFFLNQLEVKIVSHVTYINHQLNGLFGLLIDDFICFSSYRFSLWLGWTLQMGQDIWWRLIPWSNGRLQSAQMVSAFHYPPKRAKVQRGTIFSKRGFISVNVYLEGFPVYLRENSWLLT